MHHFQSHATKATHDNAFCGDEGKVIIYKLLGDLLHGIINPIALLSQKLGDGRGNTLP